APRRSRARGGADRAGRAGARPPRGRGAARAPRRRAAGRGEGAVIGCTLLLLLVAQAAIARDPPASDRAVTEVLRAFDHEPSVRQVQRWAAEYARLEPERVDRWLVAARRFALLP